VLVVSGAAVLASWEPDRSVEVLTPRWAQPPSQFIAVDGMQVHYRDEGPRDDPAPLVLIHGTAASLHTWDGWASELRGRHRVIRMDLPGFGLTGPSPGDDYRIEAYVSFVLHFLDALKVQRFSVGGNSLGGNIAWEVARAAPQRASKLVLVDAGGYAVTASSTPLGFRLARMPALQWLMTHSMARGIVERSVRNVYGDPARVDDALIDRYFELTLREGNRRALGLRMQQLQPGENAGHIRDLALPTLILWGARDRLVPPESAQRFHGDIAGSELVTFPELGHVPHEEDPSKTVRPVIRFLDGAPRAQP